MPSAPETSRHGDSRPEGLLLSLCLGVSVAITLVSGPALSQPAAPTAKARENAADNYIAAAAIFKPDGEAQTDAAAVLRNGWVGNHPRIEEALIQNEQAFMELREGIRKSSCAMPEVEGFDTPLPFLAAFRAMARLLLAEGRFFEARQDFEQAYRNFCDVVKFGEDVERNGVLIHFLVGLAIKNMALGVIQQTLKTPDAPAEVYAAAARRLETLETTEVTLAQALQAEFACCDRGVRQVVLKAHAKILQRMGVYAFHCPPFSLLWGQVVGMAQGVHRASGEAALPGALIVWLLYPPCLETSLANIKTYAAAAIARAELPYPDAAKMRLTLPNDPVSRMLLPAFDRVGFMCARYRAQAALARTMLALAAHKKRSGAYPPALDSLGIKPPIDAFSGKPLHYRRLGDGFILYSIGPDGVDDNGEVLCPDMLKEDTKGDIVCKAGR